MITKAPAGTQSVLRTVRLLKVIAERKDIGWRLTDLAAHCGLDKSTTYRLLACLTSQRMLAQRADKRYVPGPLLYELSLSLPSYADFRDSVRPHLQELARHLKGTAFLYLLAGDEVICIDRVGATLPPPLTGIGTRRPILQSTFGVAMMLAMGTARQKQILKQGIGDISAKRAAAYRKIFQQSKRYGFGVNMNDVVPGLSCVAVPMFRQDGKTPFASVGVMAPSTDFVESRLKSLAKSVAGDVRHMESQFQHQIAYFHG
jgi:DNA-binding IclR family transcriptional regulator